MYFTGLAQSMFYSKFTKATASEAGRGFAISRRIEIFLGFKCLVYMGCIRLDINHSLCSNSMHTRSQIHCRMQTPSIFGMEN